MHYSHDQSFGRSEIKIFSAVRHTCQTYGRWWVGSVYGNPGHDIVRITPPPHKNADTVHFNDLKNM